jgi:hypothetical protein
MTKNVLRFALAAAALVGFAPAARAGLAVDYPVDISGKSASGSLNGARTSADSVQYIGCSVKYDVATDKTEVSCVARNEFEKSLGCSTTKAGFVPVAVGISDYAWIYFKCEGSELVALTASKFSHNLP